MGGGASCAWRCAAAALVRVRVGVWVRVRVWVRVGVWARVGTRG